MRRGKGWLLPSFISSGCNLITKETLFNPQADEDDVCACMPVYGEREREIDCLFFFFTWKYINQGAIRIKAGHIYSCTLQK